MIKLLEIVSMYILQVNGPVYNYRCERLKAGAKLANTMTKREMKMATKKKVMFNIAMILILSLSVIAGACSKKEATESGKGASPAASDKVGESPANGNSASSGDLPTETGDKKISFLFSHVGFPYAMKMGKDDRYVKYLNEISGYETSFEFLGNAEDYTVGITTRFASGDLPHVIRTNSVDDRVFHPGAVDNDVFWDLTDLLDKYAPTLRKSIPEETWKSPKVTHNGRIYGIPQPLGFYSAYAVPYIRQDWLDRLQMEQPVTVDDWLAYFDAVTKTDLNGNGQADEYGFSVRANLLSSEMFFQNFEAFPTAWYEQDGQIVPGIIADGMKDALQLWRTMYEKKYINQDFLTKAREDWTADIFNSRAGSWVHDVSNYSSEWGEKAGNWPADANPKLSIVKPPGNVMMPKEPDIYFVMVFPRQHDNIVDVLKFLEWAWSNPEADKFFDYGIPGHNYTETNGEIVWDPGSEANATDQAYTVYQVSINPRELNLNNENVLKFREEADILLNGQKIAQESVFSNVPYLYMPSLKAYENNPELIPGTNSGTLFMDMFAKVVTGKEDIDTAFPAFVAEWKKRGGEAAILEATAWYNDFMNK